MNEKKLNFLIDKVKGMDSLEVDSSNNWILIKYI
jgi:hypothetical protein